MTQMKLDWRWVFIALLVLNIMAGFMGLLAEEQRPAAAPQTSPPETGMPHLELVSEVAPARAGHANQAQCFTIGPLSTLLAQQRAEDRLRPFTSRLQLRQTSADQDRGWWVHLPAGSRSEALQLTRRLAELGVEDYYVIAGGSLANSVSVGLFESLDNARARQRSIRALGFDAQLEVRRESVPRFWVDYEVEPGEEPPWRFILRASPGAQRLSIPCFPASADSGDGASA